MRTTFPLAVVLALGIAMAFFAGSGFNAIVDGDQSGAAVTEEIDEAGDESVVGNGSINASRASSDEGSIAGIILSGGQGILNFIGMVALLPLTLRDLGFPAWFANPVGSVVYVVAGIGAIQFITNRVLQ